ncbi:hypothetical protein DICPUDRAFT_98907 [Dictyostelium purpureum]|uniref:Importin N-terminal domain-containing protein n=1 Tax=Dictyostelium purpureum TaxID=5786 RepID=F0ZUP1_DICPU|nr:uncharacterized protein DICPUDRAFT_98907 [Dictyostelium purpureum]EGC32343.1 hypothetical protein DICPUDRAFT_98907 [Dictyostelium purpureum]|eukprot:XP_003291145.1 hypothetical protein DICPUDRAFT_98907 [Dictyostelium purpureum]
MEQILDFSTPLNLQTLDQILEQQQATWTKVNELLKSSSNRIKFFGLTILENSVIKKKLLNQLNQEQKSSIVTELLQITLSFSSSDSNASIVKKKAASLISQIIVKEWLNSNNSNESFQFIQNYISQLIKCVSEPASYQLDQLYGVMMVFSNLGVYVKQEDDYKSTLKNIQDVFDMIFIKAFELFDFLEKSKSNITSQQKPIYDELVKEILKTVSSLFDLVTIDHCLRLDLILFLINKMNDQQNQTNSYVLTLSEHINVLVSKVMAEAAQSGQTSPKLNQVVSSIFKTMVVACSKSIPEKIKSSTMLLENIATLFTTYLKNFLLVLETLDTETTLYCEKYLINIMPLLPIDRLTLVLEYFNQLYKGFLTTGDNQKVRLQLHASSIPLFFTSILAILENHDEEEDNEIKGILFTKIQDCTETTTTTAIVDKNDEEEEWKKVETLLSETLESIGLICFNDAFDFFTKKLFDLLSSSGDEKHKMNSTFWCLGYLCKFSTQFDVINTFIGKIIDDKTLSSLAQNKRFTMISGLLFFISRSTKYLEFQQNSQYIKSILQIIITQLLPSKSQSLVQISIITLDIIISTRKQYISLDSPELHIFLNQFIQQQGATSINTSQIEMIYKCIGSFIFNFYTFNQSQFNNNSLTQILNPLIEQLKSNNNYQDNFKLWSNTINNNLNFNISLAKSMKNLFNVQMSQLYPILIDLFKWSNQEHQPIEKFSGSQISFKKNIIELLTAYIDNQSTSSNTPIDPSLQNTLLLFLEALCQDPTRTSQIYVTEVLPKTISFISSVISTFKSNLSTQISKGLFDTFYKFSLEQAFNQSNQSRGLLLLSKIWNLVNSIQINNPSLLTSDINSGYFELINKCLDNISPSINGSALDSLVNYFTNIRSTPQLFDFNILLHEYIKILNLFYNSEYQTSLDKITKLLFIMIQLTVNNNNSKLQLMTLLEQKYKSISNNNNIAPKIQQLFNINNLELFENNIKLIYK